MRFIWIWTHLSPGIFGGLWVELELKWHCVFANHHHSTFFAYYLYCLGIPLYKQKNIKSFSILQCICLSSFPCSWLLSCSFGLTKAGVEVGQGCSAGVWLRPGVGRLPPAATPITFYEPYKYRVNTIFVSDFACVRIVVTAGVLFGKFWARFGRFSAQKCRRESHFKLFHGYICVYVSFSARILAYPIHDMQNHEETLTLKPKPKT